MDCLLVPPKDARCLNFTEKTFLNSHKTLKFAKVFSLKNFPLYGWCKAVGCLGSMLVGFSSERQESAVSIIAAGSHVRLYTASGLKSFSIFWLWGKFSSAFEMPSSELPKALAILIPRYWSSCTWGYPTEYTDSWHAELQRCLWR